MSLRPGPLRKNHVMCRRSSMRPEHTIHWVDLPVVSGREQRGRRPAIVIQDEKVGEKLPTVLVVPLTSSQRAMRFAGTALIAATEDSGLKNDSVALVFQALAIDRSRVDERTGSVSETERAEVQKSSGSLSSGSLSLGSLS